MRRNNSYSQKSNQYKKQPLGGSPEKIRAAALRMLDRRGYLKAELFNKLVQKGAEKDAARQVIADLEASGLVDDAKTAEAIIHSRKSVNVKGRKYVERELRFKGLDGELAQNSLEDYYSPAEEREILERLVLKQARNFSADWEKRRKETNSLVRKMAARGFPPGEVFDILNNAADIDEAQALDNEDDL